MLPYDEKHQLALLKAIARGDVASSHEAVAQEFYDPAARQRGVDDLVARQLRDLQVPADGKFILLVGGGQLSGKSQAKRIALDVLEGLDIREGQILEISNGLFKDHLPEYAALRWILPGTEEVLVSRIASEGLPGIRPGTYPFARPPEALSAESKVEEMRAMAYPFVREEADEIKLKMILEAAKRGLPIIVEDQLSTPLYAKLPTLLPDYKKIILAPHISVEEFFRRGEQRRLARRFLVREFLWHHKQSEEWMAGYERLCDMAIRLDNNVPKGAAMNPFAVTHEGTTHILDEEVHEQARRKKAINIEARTAEEVYADGQDRTRDPERSERSVAEGGRKSRRGRKTVAAPGSAVEEAFAERAVRLIEEHKGRGAA